MENNKSDFSSKFNRSLTIHTTSATTTSSNFFKKHSLYLDRTVSEKRIQPPSASNSIRGKVKALCHLFESQKKPSSRSSRLGNGNFNNFSIKLPGADDKIVIYFTSLRGVRRTYEDCYTVRMIFRGFRVYVDERARFGNSSVPMEDAMANVSVDLSGRANFIYNVTYRTDKIGDFDVECIEEFLRSLANNGKFNLHINVPYGTNSHHIAEAIFKGLGQALYEAVKIVGDDIPSTKGTL